MCSNPTQARRTALHDNLSVTCGRSVVFQGTPISSINKTDCHEITVILLLKVVLNTNDPNPIITKGDNLLLYVF
jgi:hypothetical protein